MSFVNDENKGENDFQLFAKLASESFDENVTKSAQGLELLVTIDRVWKKCYFSGLVHSDLPLAVMLVANGHNIFRAALTLALNGHSAPVYPLLRNFLESCLYAFLIANKPNFAEVWSSRNRDESAKKKCRNEISARAAINELLKIDSNLGNHLNSLYEYSIDFGAHPNISGLALNLELAEFETHVSTEFTFLHGSSVETSRALLACAENGTAALYLIRHVLPDRTTELDIDDALNAIHEELCPELFGLKPANLTGSSS